MESVKTHQLKVTLFHSFNHIIKYLLYARSCGTQDRSLLSENLQVKNLRKILPFKCEFFKSKEILSVTVEIFLMCVFIVKDL